MGVKTLAFETTICTCVEAGALEHQALLLAESLRTFGGRYANLPFMAVKPRAGPAISRLTRQAFDRLGVTFIDKPLSVEFAWWDMANKPAAMRYAEENAKTPCVTWMDGDMAVLQEPLTFAPPPDADFMARAGEATDVASSGADDRVEYWRQLCDMFNLDFDRFPIITSFPDSKSIRAYWQGGLYTYRTSSRFGAMHGEIYGRMLNGAIASKYAGIYHMDQVSIALTVQALGLRHAEYDPRMNFNVNPLDKIGALRLPIEDVRILHYHGSLSPQSYDWARTLLEKLPSDRLDLFDRFAPLRSPPLATRVHRKLYSLSRAGKLRDLERRVVQY